jgi:2-keto-4-pentenoate hydratase/2-oxohepta-3-ene-1,7-dioic acid hydratase in catechol pathway
VGADLVDPQNIDVECLVNGEVRQSANTSDMIFNCAQLVAYASRFMTLEPGDIFYTGTPQGVILGYPPEKQTWLKAGDVLLTRMGPLGELEITLT